MSIQNSYSYIKITKKLLSIGWFLNRNRYNRVFLNSILNLAKYTILYQRSQNSIFNLVKVTLISTFTKTLVHFHNFI